MMAQAAAAEWEGKGDLFQVSESDKIFNRLLVNTHSLIVVAAPWH
jgi:hypothetical protein